MIVLIFCCILKFECLLLSRVGKIFELSYYGSDAILPLAQLYERQVYVMWKIGGKSGVDPHTEPNCPSQPVDPCQQRHHPRKCHWVIEFFGTQCALHLVYIINHNFHIVTRLNLMPTLKTSQLKRQIIWKKALFGNSLQARHAMI